jgi:ubiquinone/menaquinone biosynthesis C-methylase UbiE
VKVDRISPAHAYAQRVAPSLLGVARRVIALAGIEEGQTILDAGTNTGLGAFLAASRVGEDGTVVALDPDPDFLAVAEARATAAGYGEIRWQAGALGVLKFAEEAFDHSISVHALDLAPEPVTLIEELRRVTVERGVVVVSTWGAKHGNEWLVEVERAVRRYGGVTLPSPAPASEPGNLEVLMQASGFDDIEAVRYPDHLRMGSVEDVWKWVKAVRSWSEALAGLSEGVSVRVLEHLRDEFGDRIRGGELLVGREICIVRGVVPTA